MAEGPLSLYTCFVDEKTDGHRGPTAELSGTGTFASLLQPRVGSITVHLTLSIGFPRGLLPRGGSIDPGSGWQVGSGIRGNLGGLGWGVGLGG